VLTPELEETLKKLKGLKNELDQLAKELDEKEKELKKLEDEAEQFMRSLRADQLGKCGAGLDGAKDNIKALEAKLAELFGLTG
jgi:chromosome segregation ATPase